MRRRLTFFGGEAADCKFPLTPFARQDQRLAVPCAISGDKSIDVFWNFPAVTAYSCSLPNWDSKPFSPASSCRFTSEPLVLAWANVIGCGFFRLFALTSAKLPVQRFRQHTASVCRYGCFSVRRRARTYQSPRLYAHPLRALSAAAWLSRWRRGIVDTGDQRTLAAAAAPLGAPASPTSWKRFNGCRVTRQPWLAGPIA